jgi:hypothetical protein
VVFTVILFQLSLEYTNDKLFVEIGGWLFVAEGHKLNITDGITDKIILSVTLLVIMLVKMFHHHVICLF